MKRMIVKWFWNNYHDFILDRKGFVNNTIHYEKQFLRLFMDIYTQRRAELSIREMYNIFTLVKKLKNVEGDIAEVGVYRGGSAKIICEVKGNKRLHLFDTFEGMPDVNEMIDKHKKGDFSDTSLDDIVNYLNLYENVLFYKGYFPASAHELEKTPCQFSIVNLDVDIYESTLNGLKFFYPRMNRGGMILSHDYRSISCPGVKKAYDEFFIDKPEHIIELWDTQCLMIKQ